MKTFKIYSQQLSNIQYSITRYNSLSFILFAGDILNLSSNLSIEFFLVKKFKT